MKGFTLNVICSQFSLCKVRFNLESVDLYLYSAKYYFYYNYGIIIEI